MQFEKAKWARKAFVWDANLAGSGQSREIGTAVTGTSRDTVLLTHVNSSTECFLEPIFYRLSRACRSPACNICLTNVNGFPRKSSFLTSLPHRPERQQYCSKWPNERRSLNFILMIDHTTKHRFQAIFYRRLSGPMIQFILNFISILWREINRSILLIYQESVECYSGHYARPG
jgi:hypothetical protein